MENVEQEFLSVIREYERVIYKVCYLYTTPNATLNDLYQEVVLNIWKAFPKFRRECKISTWIYRIAYNTALSFLRKKNVEQTVIDDNQWNRISDTQIDDALNNESEEQIEKLQQALTKLTAEERALVTLFYEEEHSIQELAQILNLNEGNIKVKLHRLRKKLYVLMQKED